MKITIITQSDPFFLAKNIDYLLKNLPSHSKVVSAVVSNASPFGKNKSFLDKVRHTINVFGLIFTLHYGIKYILNKFNPSSNVESVFKKNNIPVIHLEKSINDPESLEKIRSFNPDLLISIAGNQIFKRPLIDLAPRGCLNLHTALLPKYRGLMPSFWVLKNNEKETGVSVFFVDDGIDSGPILVQKKIKIDNMSQAELIKCTKQLGMEAIIEAVDKIHQANYQLIPNNDNEMTYYSFPKREDVKAFYKAGKRFY